MTATSRQGSITADLNAARAQAEYRHVAGLPHVSDAIKGEGRAPGGRVRYGMRLQDGPAAECATVALGQHLTLLVQVDLAGCTSR